MEPKTGDAFGMTLLSCLETGADDGKVLEVIERDDGQIGVGDAARYFRPPEGDSAEWVLSRARGRVLDIGAGAGRYALASQELGCDVVALDVSAGAVEVCRRRKVKGAYLGSVAYLAATSPASFDTFLLMGNNLGLLGAPEHAVEFLATLEDLSADGVRIIAEGNDASLTDNPEHLEYHDWNRDRGFHPHLTRLRARFGRYATEWFDYLMPSPEELAEILGPSAWTIETLERLPGMSTSGYVVDLRRV